MHPERGRGARRACRPATCAGPASGGFAANQEVRCRSARALPRLRKYTAFWRLDRFEQFVDYPLDTHPFGFRRKIRQHTVPQHGMQDALDVVRCDVEPAMEERIRFRAKDEGLTRARSSALTNVLLDEWRRGFVVRTCRLDEVRRVPERRFRGGHLAHHMLKRQRLTPIHDRGELRSIDARGVAQNRDLLLR